MSFGFFPDMGGGGGTIVRRQLITASGTWSRPSGMVSTTVWLTMIGGGGAGNATTTAGNKTGGDGGQYIVRRSINIGDTTSVACTVGAGGTGNGGNGAPTSFGAFISVSGGRGGAQAGAYTGGARGINGASYCGASSVPGIFGGPGGIGPTNQGHGGGGLILDETTTSGADIANSGFGGRGYGAGGAGGFTGSGGAGAPGAILIEWLEAIS